MTSKADIGQHYMDAFRYAKSRLRRSDDEVRELIHRVFDKLLTTHPHDPEKGPLRTWVILLVNHEAHALFEEEAGCQRIVETAAQYANHERSALADAAMPPDEVLTARVEQTTRAATLAHLWDLLPQLLERLAHHAVASAMISEWMVRGGADLTPKQLAERLGVTKRQIYKARDLIEYHAKKIREGEAA